MFEQYLDHAIGGNDEAWADDVTNAYTCLIGCMIKVCIYTTDTVGEHYLPMWLNLVKCFFFFYLSLYPSHTADKINCQPAKRSG